MYWNCELTFTAFHLKHTKLSLSSRHHFTFASFPSCCYLLHTPLCSIHLETCQTCSISTLHPLHPRSAIFSSTSIHSISERRMNPRAAAAAVSRPQHTSSCICSILFITTQVGKAFCTDQLVLDHISYWGSMFIVFSLPRVSELGWRLYILLFIYLLLKTPQKGCIWRQRSSWGMFLPKTLFRRLADFWWVGLYNWDVFGSNVPLLALSKAVCFSVVV